MKALMTSVAAIMTGTTANATTREPPITSQLQYESPTAIQPRAAAGDTAIRPFRVDIPDEKLTELRRRIRATQWPEKETVGDHSQGVPLALMQELARHWAADYDWRKVEAKLNAVPQFITEIDGLDIHFIHVRSKHATRCRSSSPTDGPALSTTVTSECGTLTKLPGHMRVLSWQASEQHQGRRMSSGGGNGE